MNPYVEEMNYLMHYGVPRRSGRYPWGSGDNPYQHSGDFLSRIESLKKEGKTEKEIADELQLPFYAHTLTKGVYDISTDKSLCDDKSVYGAI